MTIPLILPALLLLSIGASCSESKPAKKPAPLQTVTAEEQISTVHAVDKPAWHLRMALTAATCDDIESKVVASFEAGKLDSAKANKIFADLAIDAALTVGAPGDPHAYLLTAAQADISLLQLTSDADENLVWCIDAADIEFANEAISEVLSDETVVAKVKNDGGDLARAAWDYGVKIQQLTKRGQSEKQGLIVVGVKRAL